MKHIIYEYSEVKEKNLKEYIINTPLLHKYFKYDWGILKSQKYCGILNFEDKDFYLLPKISNRDDDANLDIFIYMLMYAYDIKLENEDIASCKNETHNILEVFIQLFAKKLFKDKLANDKSLLATKGGYSEVFISDVLRLDSY